MTDSADYIREILNTTDTADLSVFFCECLEPFYDPECDGIDARYGDLVFNLSNQVLRHDEIIVFRRDEKTVSLSDWRAEWFAFRGGQIQKFGRATQKLA